MIRMLGGLVGLQDEAEAAAERLEAVSTRFGNRPARFRIGAAGVLRRMGRPTDFGNPVGRGARRDRRRRANLPRSPSRRTRERSHRLRRDRARARRRTSSWRPGAARRCVRRRSKAGPVGIDVPRRGQGHIYEIKSTYILQPGPASLTEGVPTGARRADRRGAPEAWPRGAARLELHGPSLKCHRHPEPAADAQRREAELRAAPPHLVKQRHDDAGTGRADGMPERDRAAVDIDAGRIDRKIT